jgi:hypothetical protein
VHSAAFDCLSLPAIFTFAAHRHDFNYSVRSFEASERMKRACFVLQLPNSKRNLPLVWQEEIPRTLKVIYDRALVRKSRLEWLAGARNQYTE